MSQKWQAQRERGTVFWLRVITWIALRVGRPIAWFLQYPITLYFYATSWATRRASFDFLGRVFGRPATHLESYRHHRMFACTILDRVYLLSGRHNCLDVHLHGAQAVLDQIADGSGCMILGSHLGSFEVLRALGVRHDGFDIRVLMRPEQNPAITNFLNELDPSIEKVVIPLGRPDSMIRVKEAADAGHLVGLLGDRALNDEKTISCEFLGKCAPFPTGPSTLAVILGLPVFLFFGIYRGRNRYDIYFERLSDGLDSETRSRESQIVGLTERFAERLEQFARQFPYNWFNFYDFWQPH